MGGRAGRARDPERGESLRAMYSDKQTLEELRTGLIESAGIECSGFFANCMSKLSDVGSDRV
jgi:hypothetical protein